MELEQLQAQWQQMSAGLETQKKLTADIISKMARANYASKINKIRLPEMAGSVGCFVLAGLTALNLQNLNTWYLLACGIATAVVLVLLAVISICSIKALAKINVSGNNYSQSLAQYSTGRVRFAMLQKINIVLGALLMVVVLPVSVKLIAGVDFFKQGNLWMWYALCFPLFYISSSRIFKYYVSLAKQAENILAELAE